MLADGLLDHLVVGEDAAWGAGPAGPTASPPTRARCRVRRAGGRNPPAPGRRPRLGDLAVLQYTGGTTGVPRAAMLTHANLSSAVSSYEAFYDGVGRGWQDDRDRIIGVLPLFHIYMLTTVLLRGLSGGRGGACCANVLTPHRRWTTSRRGAPPIFPGVPTMFHRADHATRHRPA